MGIEVNGTTGSVPVNYENANPATAIDGDQPDGSLLPEPNGLNLPVGGDAGAELAAIVMLAAKDQRNMARATRSREEEALEAAERSHIDALREKAANAFASGMAEGLTSIASGGIEFYGAGDVGECGANENLARVCNGKWAATSKFTEGGGKVIGTVFKADADEDDVEATRQGQLEEHHKSAIEDAKDGVDDAKKLLEKAMDFYKEYTTAKNDSQKAAFLRA